MKIHTVKSDFLELFGKRKNFTKNKDKYRLSCHCDSSIGTNKLITKSMKEAETEELRFSTAVAQTGSALHI